MNLNFSLPYYRLRPLRIIALSIILGSCASVKKIAVEGDVVRMLRQSETFSNHFTGFSLYDLESDEFVAGYNSTMKFTPASNTKLLTMYVTLKSFGDSIPAFTYLKKDSSLYVSPMGDPTFFVCPF